MEAAVLKDDGSDPEFGEFKEPEANGLALVEVSVAGLNPVDHTIASGRFPGREPPLPSVPGLEGIGTVSGRRVYFDSPVACKRQSETSWAFSINRGRVAPDAREDYSTSSHSSAQLERNAQSGVRRAGGFTTPFGRLT